jgi:hypothetical protein
LASKTIASEIHDFRSAAAWSVQVSLEAGMNKPCSFSESSLSFAGTPAEQAACLLRKVRVAGNVDDAPATLPQLLRDRVGQTVGFTRGQLRAYLAHKGISERDIGGTLDNSVSATASGTKARYFVIHDTSDELKGNAFPANINDASFKPNDLQKRTTSSAHLFINRLGQSVTGHDYSQAFRATKRERNAALKGLFLHHELVQPRIKGAFKFHAVGPDPGFAAAQIERLAVCYLAASLRRGTWLIPAFHCVLDLGIADGHDDPQNFDLFQWAGAIERVLAEVAQTIPAAAPDMAEAAPRAAAVAFAAAPAATAPTAAPPALETVRSDLTDGPHKNLKLQRVVGTTPVFFKAKMACDADGAARAYHPEDDPDALDLLTHATSGSKRFIQGKKKNGKLGLGPRPGFFVSETSLSRGVAWDANSFVDAEFVPYIVLPPHFSAGVKPGSLCTVVNLNNFRSTAAIVADSNPKVGEASVRVVIDLHVNDPSMPITDLARRGGDGKDRYVYIIYPDEILKARAAAPHWPVEDITARADPLFAAWGGIDMVKRIFAAA